MRRIDTSIVIEASPAAVWETLLDFEAYPEWNPFITAIRGDPQAGARLDVTVRPVGGKRMSFRPTVQPPTQERHFHWVGRVGFQGLFDGHHEFILQPQGDSVLLRHVETFTGILVPLFWRNFAQGTQKGFEAMNQALKERVEPAAG